mmetsp:Transcript_35661/g.42977  ORF Transcript_35661/g.42977 Transcript_35661/m.42977 type:complete len:514 (+) Transcript_35661:76-1617(+)|eukprot:CAMPEP_0197862124 /NCGR_PEP_ID=MMETSP1438-20131217/38641_1 /TAXON_ID=1461541 /ORGANISM="Pterosperma sp., Strain CCMP1384" /LENGTH=513 /DNA_ID=CAMNT_0043479563 /DNA_START=68 /DNA_END=1609 /DNA_ORIENTATION=-
MRRKKSPDKDGMEVDDVHTTLVPPKGEPIPSAAKWGTPNWSGWNAQLVLVGTLLFSLTCPLWLGQVDAQAGQVVVGLICFLSILMFLGAAPVAMSHQGRKLYTKAEDKGGKDVKHAVCVTLYKEADEVVIDTLKSLNEQSVAKNITVLLAMEEATDRVPERIAKYKAVLTNVAGMKHYVHPKGLALEVPGKCSNEAWSAREFVKELQAAGTSLDDWTFTSSDSDCVFHKESFADLERKFREWKGDRPAIWQHLPAFFVKRDESYWFALGASMVRIAWTASLNPLFNIQPVSVYSLAMNTLIKAGYHHPGYIGEDFMIFAQTTLAYGTTPSMQILDQPCVMGPTLGETSMIALNEFTAQAYRWAAQILEGCGFMWHNATMAQVPVVVFYLTCFWWARLWSSSIPVFVISAVVAVHTELIDGGEVLGTGCKLEWLVYFLAFMYSLTVITAPDGESKYRARFGKDEFPDLSIVQQATRFVLLPLVSTVLPLVELVAFVHLLMKGKVLIAAQTVSVK